MSALLKKNDKLPFSALNMKHRDEPVATDAIYSSTSTADDRSTSAQIFVGTETLVTDSHRIKFNKTSVNTLEDNIRTQGAISKVMSDRTQVEISSYIKDIL